MAVVIRNLIIVFAAIGFPLLSCVFIVGDAVDHSMFRAPADMIGDALQPPARVRFVLFMLGVYIPLAAIVGLLQMYINDSRAPALGRTSANPLAASHMPTPRGRARRWAYGVTSAAVISVAAVLLIQFLQTTPQEEKAAQSAREELLPSFGAVLSPSANKLGRASIAGYGDHNELRLTVDALDATNRAAVDAGRLLRHGLIVGDGLVLSWTDELHLVVAGMIDGRPPAGPERVGDVQVSYMPFVFGRVERHDADAAPVSMSNVTYSVEQATMRAIKPDTPMCAIHVQGTDERLHRRVGINLIGIGVQINEFGSKLVRYALMFDATDLPSATGTMTLTQAVLDDVGYARFTRAPGGPDDIKVNPGQADVLLPTGQVSTGRNPPFMQNLVYSSPISRDRVTTMFDRFREGRYQAAFEFGLGRQVVTYTFDTPIPPNIGEQFQKCEAAAEMMPPLIGPHLTSD